jgi:hypothetical protein
MSDLVLGGLATNCHGRAAWGSLAIPMHMIDDLVTRLIQVRRPVDTAKERSVAAS